MILPNGSLLPHQCVGFGIVRAIDQRSQTFYILTPVSFGVLQKVNLLLRAPMDLPASILADGESDTSKLPYTTLLFSDGVGAATSRNRHIQRKK